MREIKFRGKSKVTGEWLYGDLIRTVNGDFAIIPPFNGEGCRDVEYEVNENTIGQFTGLTDKEGKEIYEGDILDFHNMLFNSVAIYNEEESAFCLKLIGSKLNGFNSIGSYQSLGYELTILGNRWDNPELLKGGEE